MAKDSCSVPRCRQEAIVHTYPVWKRRIVHQAIYCDEHAEVFLSSYSRQHLAGEGSPQYWRDAAHFDIELLISDDRPEMPCRLFLREVGGSRRLDCNTGVFEVAAIQRELERLSAPRPLTHRAMASLITSLGGRLECVEIDQYFPDQKITYEAKLHIQQGEVAVTVDVRPSDAVVLAVICDVPIVLSKSVLALMPGM